MYIEMLALFRKMNSNKSRIISGLICDMSTAVKKRLRKDLLTIIGSGVVLVAGYIVLYTTDDNGQRVQEWAEQFYTFLIG